jgi:hypothetical protein
LTQDLNIYYTGGSGGFIFLHCLLLSKQYFLEYHYSLQQLQSSRAQLANNKLFTAWFLKHARLSQYDYNSVQGQHWPQYQHYVQGQLPTEDLGKYLLTAYLDGSNDLIYDRDTEFDFLTQLNIDHQWQARPQWKSTEIWPNNELTLRANTQRPRVFFHCNNQAAWYQYPGTKIMLYTDVHSQLRMCSYKSAGMFFDTAGHSRYSIHRQHLKTAVFDQQTQCQIDTWAAEDISRADVLVKLQDLVNCPQHTLAQFGIVSDSQQMQLLQKWKAQHPDQLLNKSGIRTK